MEGRNYLKYINCKFPMIRERKKNKVKSLEGMNRKGKKMKKMHTFLNNKEILNIKVKRKDSGDRKIASN